MLFKVKEPGKQTVRLINKPIRISTQPYERMEPVANTDLFRKVTGWEACIDVYEGHTMAYGYERYSRCVTAEAQTEAEAISKALEAYAEKRHGF